MAVMKQGRYSELTERGDVMNPLSSTSEPLPDLVRIDEFVGQSTGSRERDQVHLPTTKPQDCLLEESPRCDACPHCGDRCARVDCLSCRPASPDSETDDTSVEDVGKCGFPWGDDSSQLSYYTPCQLRRHNTMESAWLLVGDTIYDATTYLRRHPGGSTSILRRAGGAVDCGQDLAFHSRKGRRMWNEYKIGKLRSCCGDAPSRIGTDEQCVLM
eukprot:CAMPEP_0194032834 /NCGR_PEP_ID=MMETSP0009_2-20130614/5688_1 /TAXON_ID=210454 /ORGANISM="Grammatophora oceanica, Strain CCMP 410" /LENGTH=213 /DNA_ID=CAMNT_0038673389 /DNA_START=24 /DNA_END=665 /DNA_ORIENTATION=-